MKTSLELLLNIRLRPVWGLLAVLVAMPDAATAQSIDAKVVSVQVFESGDAWVVEEATMGAVTDSVTIRLNGQPGRGPDAVSVTVEGDSDLVYARVNAPADYSPARIHDGLSMFHKGNVFVTVRGKTVRGRLLHVGQFGDGQFMVVESSDSQILIPVKDIEAVEVEGKPLTRDFFGGRIKQTVDVRLTKKSGTATIRLAYRQSGLNWQARYRLDLGPSASDSTLRLVPVVTNFAFPMTGVKTELWAGALFGQHVHAMALVDGPKVVDMNLGDTLVWQGASSEVRAVRRVILQVPQDSRVVHSATPQTVIEVEGPAITALIDQAPVAVFSPDRAVPDLSEINVSNGGKTARLDLGTTPGITYSLEEKVDSKPSTVKVNDIEYRKLIVKGSVTIVHSETDKRALLVAVVVPGELEDASGKPSKQVHELNTGSASANPQTLVTWEVVLSPGKPVDLEYEYSTLVPVGAGQP